MTLSDQIILSARLRITEKCWISGNVKLFKLNTQLRFKEVFFLGILSMISTKVAFPC